MRDSHVLGEIRVLCIPVFMLTPNYPLHLYQLSETQGLSESDSKGLNEPTEAENIKSFFHPLKQVVVLATTALNCACSMTIILI